jgi:uncharacterized HAD superfamily protein
MAKIGIDIDETLSHTNKSMIEYYKKNINADINENPFFTAKTKKEIENLTLEFKKAILNEKVEFINPIDHAREVIENLDKTNKLYLITARHIDLSKKTRKWVETYFKNIFFEDIRHVEYRGLVGVVKDKEEICKELKIDIMIDDNLNSSLKCAKIGIPVILFDLNGEYYWNKSKTELPDNMTRVKNWKEVYKVLNEKYNIF